MVSSSRVLLAAGAVALAFLALPQLASAKPGTAPELVQRSGRFVILHADERDGGSTRQPMLANGLRETPVRAPAGVWIEPGSRVRLEGAMQNGTLVVADSLTAVRQLAPSPNAASATSAAPSTESTAVVMFYFSNQTANALPSQAAATATMSTGPTSLRGYYSEQTYGDITFLTTVFAPVQLAEPAPGTGDCTDSIFTWAEEAAGLAQGGAFNPSQYKHIIFAFPALPQSVCGWSGLAQVGGSLVWTNGSLTVPVLAHELGHNLGLWHAGGLSCTSAGAPAPMGDNCTIDRVHYQLPQYADPFDAMGNAPVLRQMSMEHKLALGVLPATAVQTVSVSGTYVLAPMETLTGSVELLILPKPGGGNYFVEYRAPTAGFDFQPTNPSPAGVLVHTESPEIANLIYDSDTALIDMHPDGTFGAGQWQNAAMSPMQVFTDAATGISIQDVAQDASGATLAVTMPVDTQPPSRPSRLSAVASGTTVALQWTAAADNFGVTAYRVARNGSDLGALTGTTFTDSGVAPGTTVNYAVTAVDAAGNVGLPAMVSVAVPDTIAPSAPANVRAVVTRGGQVHITWSAAADNVGVTSYRILRAGTGLAQANVLAYADSAPRAGTGATVTYSVVAFDAVGNAGPPGLASPLRAALLRKLAASHLKLSRAPSGTLVRLRGTLSDVEASCRVRLGRAAWHPCKVAAVGTFSASLRRTRAKLLTLSLRDELGRVRLQTLRVP